MVYKTRANRQEHQTAQYNYEIKSIRPETPFQKKVYRGTVFFLKVMYSIAQFLNLLKLNFEIECSIPLSVKRGILSKIILKRLYEEKIYHSHSTIFIIVNNNSFI